MQCVIHHQHCKHLHHYNIISSLSLYLSLYNNTITSLSLSLSLSITTPSHAQHENIAPSEELYNTLLKQSRMSFSYKLALCRRMQSQDAPPSLQFITACEASIRRARLMIASSVSHQTIDCIDVPSIMYYSR